MLMNPCLLAKANPKCYVCSEKPEVVLQVNPSTMTLKQLNDKVCLARVQQLFYGGWGVWLITPCYQPLMVGWFMDWMTAGVINVPPENRKGPRHVCSSMRRDSLFSRMQMLAPIILKPQLILMLAGISLTFLKSHIMHVACAMTQWTSSIFSPAPTLKRPGNYE